MILNDFKCPYCGHEFKYNELDEIYNRMEAEIPNYIYDDMEFDTDYACPHCHELFTLNFELNYVEPHFNVEATK